MLQVTGSPLSSDAYHWIYQSLSDVWLASVSGGTDVAGIFRAVRRPSQYG